MLFSCRFYLIAILAHCARLSFSQQFYTLTYQQAQQVAQQYYYPQQQYYYPQQFVPSPFQQPTIVYQVPQQQPTYFVQQPAPGAQPQEVAPQLPASQQQASRAPPPQAQQQPSHRHSSAVKHQNISPSAPAGASIPKPPKPDYLSQTEFDLPPPPPSRFLPDDERAKILHRARLNRPTVQQKQQEAFLVEEQKPAQRIRHEQRRPEVATTTPRPVVRTVATEPPRPPPPPPPPVVVEPEQRPVSHLSPNKANPNKVFLDCCLKKNVDKACESRCNFDVISKKVLTGMFIGSDPCPQTYGLDLFTCAAQDSDHRDCCRRKNVQRTTAGDKCLAFCNMSPGSHFQADATYLPCWAVLNDVKTCFKEAILEA